MNTELSLTPEQTQAVEQRIDYWKSRLLDFSRRNRLLYYKPSQSSTVEIITPAPEELFDRLVVKGKTLTFPLSKESDSEPVEILDQDLGPSYRIPPSDSLTARSSSTISPLAPPPVGQDAILPTPLDPKKPGGEVDSISPHPPPPVGQDAILPTPLDPKKPIGEADNISPHPPPPVGQDAILPIPLDPKNPIGEPDNISPLAPPHVGQDAILPTPLDPKKPGGEADNISSPAPPHVGQDAILPIPLDPKNPIGEPDNISPHPPPPVGQDAILPTPPGPQKARRDGDLVTNLSEKQLNRVLYNLRSRARIAREEQGIHILFVAFGLLHWRDSQQGELVQAPLVLVPVDLVRDAAGQPYRLVMLEEDILLNPTLQEMLRQFYRIELPDIPDDLDAAGLQAFWQQVSQAVQKQAGWTVEAKTVLSTFSYQKQMMVADLEKNREILASHPLVRSMSIPGFPLPADDLELVPAAELDERVPLHSTFQVLDADSSQQEAIQAAKSGLSFVLQGPPGTGKSQTIANIIAEFLGEGRKVLFISAKMAALEVVQNRLDRVGLGDFCLQVHSFRRDKREVVEELGKSLEAVTPASPGRLQEKLSALEMARGKLNTYVRALHQPRFKLGFTAFGAYAELACLKDAPKLKFKLERIADLAPAVHQQQKELVAQLAAFPQVIENYTRHPWHGCTLTGLSFELRGEIEETLSRLVQDIGQFDSRIGILADGYGVVKPRSLEEGWELVGTATVFKPGILSVPVKEICRRYTTLYQSKLRYLRPQYWRDSGLLRDLSHLSQRPLPDKITGYLEVAGRVQTRLRDGGTGSGVEDAGIQDRVKELAELGRQIKQGWELIAGLFGSAQPPREVHTFLAVSYQDAIRWCEQRLGQMEGLRDWANFNRLSREAVDVGLGSFINQALKSGIRASEWPAGFMRQFYTLYLDAIHFQDESLRNFQGESHQVIIDQFRSLDSEHIRLAHQNIRARILQRRPQSGWMSSANTEEAILRRELNKKRRLKPLRRLFAEIPGLILALRPCLMMSPLTVSQLLSPDLFRFDLVVFDEASQVQPEEAVGAVVRASQVIIVGDRHQLPPTSFFEILETGDGFDEDEAAPEEFESILNESDAAGLPSKMLMWHYRSLDEALIAFSNYHFYHNRLLTFPAAIRNAKDVGVQFIHVPQGIYKRGGGWSHNAIEAGRVVEIILRHVRESPDLSLGVVTFSQAQRDRIQMELDRLLKDRPDLQPFFSDSVAEPFFVKNLELVQGDERDVMVFSVGYGRDESGKFVQNFGPLNREGGERRLNVAVTRARRQVKLVASIQPEDIDLSRTNSRGVKLLRSYMTLARDGLRALYAGISLDPAADFESPFEASVYEALTARGLALQKQVGVSNYRIDLAVVDPERPGNYLLGIECDGAMYHAAATARDRDRLRQQVLETLGWRIHRIWSRDWIENQEREIQKVLTAVASAVAAAASANGSPGPESAVRPVAKSLPPPEPPRSFPADPPIKIELSQGLPPGARTYREARFKAPTPGIESFYKTPLTSLSTVVKKVVDAEGPVEINLAKRRLAEVWALGRVGPRVSQTLDQAIDLAASSRFIRKNGNFLWPVNVSAVSARVPRDGQGQRSIEEIPLEELAEGVFLCVKSALSLTRDDLIRQTAWLFGLRANEKVVASIDGVLGNLVRSGKLEWRSEKFRLPHAGHQD